MTSREREGINLEELPAAPLWLLDFDTAPSSDDPALSRSSSCFVVELLVVTLEEDLTESFLFDREPPPLPFFEAACSSVDIIVGGSWSGSPARINFLPLSIGIQQTLKNVMNDGNAMETIRFHSPLPGLELLHRSGQRQMSCSEVVVLPRNDMLQAQLVREPSHFELQRLRACDI